jgi:hypothetical protein
MPVYLNSTGEQAIGNDIAGTSDAIVVESVPDLALPIESESANSGISQEQSDLSYGQMQLTPLAAIAAAGAAGLLLGMVMKKALPSVKGRC